MKEKWEDLDCYGIEVGDVLECHQELPYTRFPGTVVRIDGFVVTLSTAKGGWQETLSSLVRDWPMRCGCIGYCEHEDEDEEGWVQD